MIVKTGVRLCNLPKTYPSYQTCYRCFQKWVHAGVFEKIIKSLVQDLEKRGKISLTETFRALHDMRVSSLIKQLEPAFTTDLPERIVGDKAYDSDPLDRDIRDRFGIEMIAPHKFNRKSKVTQDGWPLRRYKRRWRVERFFAWLFAFRRVKVRYERFDENLLEVVLIAFFLIFLRNL